MTPAANGGSGSDSLLQGVGPVRSDRAEGVLFFNDLVLGHVSLLTMYPCLCGFGM